jgi:hypothetical protein
VLAVKVGSHAVLASASDHARPLLEMLQVHKAMLCICDSSELSARAAQVSKEKAELSELPKLLLQHAVAVMLNHVIPERLQLFPYASTSAADLRNQGQSWFPEGIVYEPPSRMLQATLETIFHSITAHHYTDKVGMVEATRKIDMLPAERVYLEHIINKECTGAVIVVLLGSCCHA